MATASKSRLPDSAPKKIADRARRCSRGRALILAALTAGCGLTPTLRAASPADFFESKIRPLLAAKCYACHSERAKKSEGGLALDSMMAAFMGGKSGDAIVPGNMNLSLIVQTVRNPGTVAGHRLAGEEIALLVRWIELGAAFPKDAPKGHSLAVTARDHWAYQPPRAPKLPAVRRTDWPRERLDHFVLEALEARRLEPVAGADKRALIRRATLELTGLPPTPAEIRAFLADESPAAFTRLVNRLLDSPAFGVRWGRHWLDVARFAESSGYSRNMTYPLAWRYRNYVMDAFNRDKPFDQFIREQIAGDLLPAASPTVRDEQVTATGFLTVGPKTLGEQNLLQFHLNVADDQIDATTRAFLALTVNCARCHDHKFDPIPTREYYALAGIFRSSTNYAAVETNNRNEHGGAHPLGRDGWQRLAAVSGHDQRVADAQKTYLEVVKVHNTYRDELTKQGVDWRKTDDPKMVALRKEVQEHQDIIRDLKNNPPQPPELAMAVVESAVMTNSPLYLKGQSADPGEVVPRGVLSALGYAPEKIGPHESGRLQLADWIADRRNPLTARVLVNRVWHHLFGRGLVETVDNFGALGQPPSHPELLDDLALRFMDHGWSVKWLIRTIMSSRTYQLAPVHHARNHAQDPDNLFLWRFTPQRLEGEAVRDGILMVAGQLETAPLRGSQVRDISLTQPKALQREIGRRDFLLNDITDAVPYRSAFLPMARSAMLDVMTLFDSPDPNLVVGARKVSTQPTQALFLMNSPFVLKHAGLAAERMRALAGSHDDPALTAYEWFLGRPPTATERAAVGRFLGAAEDEKKGWAQLCQVLYCSGEFRTIY